jgi:hypothetical protein
MFRSQEPLRQIEPLAEMSTRYLSKARPARKAKVTVICEPTVYTSDAQLISPDKSQVYFKKS